MIIYFIISLLYNWEYFAHKKLLFLIELENFIKEKILQKKFLFHELIRHMSSRRRRRSLTFQSFNSWMK